jgi:hypothetical protein
VAAGTQAVSRVDNPRRPHATDHSPISHRVLLGVLPGE